MPLHWLHCGIYVFFSFVTNTDWIVMNFLKEEKMACFENYK